MGSKVKVVFGLLILLMVGSLVFAGGSSELGSINDPLVTKSYVDEQINLLKQQGSGQTSNQIIVEELNPGQILVAKAGTEFILRSGTAVAYGDGSNGIPDITQGLDIIIGSNITTNHQLIFPRDDGRGIKITSGPAFVMIRGGYEIK